MMNIFMGVRVAFHDCYVFDLHRDWGAAAEDSSNKLIDTLCTRPT